MKKILAMIPVLALVMGACSDDDKAGLPELPDNDLDISVPEIPADWAPGMAYKPYVDDLPAPLGKKVDVLVWGKEKQEKSEMAVLTNEAWIWEFKAYSNNVVESKEYIRQCYFPNHEDIRVQHVGIKDDFQSTVENGDIVVLEFPVETLVDAQYCMKRLTENFADYPLVVVAGGEIPTRFSESAWRLCQRIGGLRWEEDVIPYFPDWVVGDTLTEEQEMYYHPGHVGAAYALRQVDDYAYAGSWIIVGRGDATGNLPGEVLKDRWICAPYSFNVGDTQVDGTDLGAAYVAKIAAEIKRRLPHYTNAQIADLILENADESSDPEVYGCGMINPQKIWSVVENIEAKE